ncbi:hypothetical protein FXO37_18829 [Capsicum annuum]|nr:hypothetical protein FXO37_18829 [Capsicum annuum]
MIDIETIVESDMVTGGRRMTTERRGIDTKADIDETHVVEPENTLGGYNVVVKEKGRAMVDMEKEELKFTVNSDEVIFKIQKSKKQPTYMRVEHMAPKGKEKKDETLRRGVESPKTSIFVEEYPIQRRRVIAVREIHRVTRGQKCQAAAAWPRMTLEWISPPHNPPPDDDDDDDEKMYSECSLQVAAQDPQSKEGSQDSSEDTEQEDSSVVPQYDEVTST